MSSESEDDNISNATSNDIDETTTKSGSSNDRGGRAPCLSEHERAILLRLVSKYKLIIESKHTTAPWIAKKQSTWVEIQDQFLSQPGTSNRSAKQLKKCYDNHKRTMKKEKARQEMLLKQKQPVSKNSKQIDSKHVSSSRTLHITPKSRLMESPNSTTSSANHIRISDQERNGDREMELHQLHRKRMRLLDLQIEYEEMKIKVLTEEHQMKLTLLQKQINQTDPIPTDPIILAENDADNKYFFK